MPLVSYIRFLFSKLLPRHGPGTAGVKLFSLLEESQSRKAGKEFCCLAKQLSDPGLLDSKKHGLQALRWRGHRQSVDIAVVTSLWWKQSSNPEGWQPVATEVSRTAEVNINSLWFRHSTCAPGRLGKWGQRRALRRILTSDL